jgi:hypothetical protein
MGHRLSHVTCSYICTYVNAFADSLKLYLHYDLRNIIFKIKHKLYIASGSAPPPPHKENFWVRTCLRLPYCCMVTIVTDLFRLSLV